MRFCSAFLACSWFSFKVEENFRETFEQQQPPPTCRPPQLTPSVPAQPDNLNDLFLGALYCSMTLQHLVKCCQFCEVEIGAEAEVEGRWLSAATVPGTASEAHQCLRFLRLSLFLTFKFFNYRHKR